MKNFLENPYLSLIARIIVGAVFIYAGISKISDPHTFVKEIANYHLAFDASLNFMAITLPWIELIVGIFLVAGTMLRASAAIAAILMLFFIFAVAGAMIQGLNIDCGCYGASSTKVGWPKLLENFGLFIISIYIVFFPVNKLTLENLFAALKR